MQYLIALQVRNRREVIHDRYVWMEELWEMSIVAAIQWLSNEITCTAEPHNFM